MAFGTFDLVIDGERQDGTPETKARLHLTAQGSGTLRDEAGNEFKFPAQFADRNGVAISLPYTLTLFTDTTSGNSTTIGYEGYITNGYGQQVLFTFAAPQAGSTVNLVDLTDSVVTPISDLQTFRDEAEAAQAAAETAAASVQREQASGVAGLTAAGKLYEIRIPDRLADAELSRVYVSSRAPLPTGVAATDTAALNAAIAAGGPLLLHPGHYALNAQLNLPSFTTSGNAWDENNPVRILGAGMNRTFLDYTGSGGYAIAHPTINGTTNRGQNFGVELAHFTLTGPQNFANAAHGIGLDNTRTPLIHNIALRGFPGGVGIHLYGHTKGGTFGAKIRDCRFGSNVYTQINGNTLYNPADLEDWSMRYAVWVDGPYDNTGKVNDTLISDNQVYDFLIGAVRIAGHGTWTPGSNTGGSANTHLRSNVFFSEGGRKMEEGTLSAVTSTTVMRLRQTDTLLNTDDALNAYYLSAQDADGIWQRRYIADFTGSTREVTLAAALPFLPTTSTLYRIGYADAAARTEFPSPVALQHAIYWASSYSGRSIGDYFEETVWLAAHASANPDFSFIMPEDTVNDGVYGMRADGTAWHPRVCVADRPRGSSSTPASISANDMLYVNAETPASDYGPLGMLTNSTGARVNVGDCVRILSTGTEAGASQTSGGVTVAHVIVASSGRTYFESGAEMTYAMGGRRTVKVNGATAVGSLLLPATGNTCTSVASTSATAEQAAEAIGKALTSTAGVGTVKAFIRGF